jgi:diguanylate cyclase (GGDEF)-like protein
VTCPAVISLAVSGRLVRQSERIRRLHDELNESYRRLQQLSERDELTQLFNRSTFLNRAETLHSLASGWIVMLDVDHFKAINDRYGHDAGDRALQSVGAILRDAVRTDDIVGRLGGEEFAIYLGGCDQMTAMRLTERVRSIVAESIVEDVQGNRISMTVSIGLARVDRAAHLASGLRSADQALYRAKNDGRNQVRLAA